MPCEVVTVWKKGDPLPKPKRNAAWKLGRATISPRTRQTAHKPNPKKSCHLESSPRLRTYLNRTPTATFRAVGVFHMYYSIRRIREFLFVCPILFFNTANIIFHQIKQSLFVGLFFRLGAVEHFSHQPFHKHITPNNQDDWQD